MKFWSSNNGDSVRMILGQVVGQLALLSAIPVMTRSYDADSFGVYQIAFSLAVVAQPLMTFRAELVLPALQHDANALRLLRLAMALIISVSSIAMVAGLLLSHLSAASSIGSFFTMVGLVAGATATAVVDNARLIRLREYSRLAVRNLLAGVVGAATQIAVATAGLNVVWAAAALGSGRLFAVAVTRPRTRLNEGETGDEANPYTVRRAVASIAGGFVATTTAQMLTLISAPLLGPTAAGYAGTAQRIAGGPLTLLSQGLAQSAQAEIAPIVRERRPGLTRRVLAQARAMLALAAASATLLVTLAPPLAEPLLGSGWAMAGTITAILAVPLSLSLVVGPLMAVFPILGREQVLALLQIIRLALIAGATVPAALISRDLVATAVAFAIATCVGYVLFAVAVWVACLRYDKLVQGD